MVTRFVITCRKKWIRKIQIANADLGIFVENVSVENVSVDIQTVTHRALKNVLWTYHSYTGVGFPVAWQQSVMPSPSIRMESCGSFVTTGISVNNQR